MIFRVKVYVSKVIKIEATDPDSAEELAIETVQDEFPEFWEVSADVLAEEI